MRKHKHGFILLAMLVSVMALASLISLVQIRSLANQRLSASLTSDLRDGMARDALHARLRGLVADQMLAERPRPDRPLFNGTPFVIDQNGQRWTVQIQDHAALINPYLASPAILLAALPDAGRLLEVRENLLPPGARFPRLEMSLARLGLPLAEAALFTQSTTSSQIRVENSPAELADRLRGLPGNDSLGGQVQRVRLGFVRGPQSQGL